MIQVGSFLKAADNTGAKRVQCINIPGASRRKYARLGDIITAVVKGASNQGVVQNGEIVKALVARVKKQRRRRNGSYIRFDDNAAVIVTPEGLPRGSRVFGPIAREIKFKGYGKVASLAKEIY